MKPSTIIISHFYEQLGKLFYYIAAIDGTVAKEEVTTLKQIVKSEWLPLDAYTTEFSEDAAFQIEIVFDWLNQNDWDIASTMRNFKLFKQKHPRLFTPQTVALIQKTAQDIAFSFAKRNKSEYIVLNELNNILE